MAKKEVKVKSYTRKTKSGKSVIVRAHTSKKNSAKKDLGSGVELLSKKSKTQDALPEIVHNPLYDHPDWELIPNRPNWRHGGTGPAQWKHYVKSLKSGLEKATLPEVRAELEKRLKNSKKYYKE